MRLIDADALEKSAGLFEAKACARGCGKSILHLAKTWLFNEVEKAPTIDAVPVTEAELKHLINDTIAYIWRLEDRGCDKPEFGYDSRKALLEKLKQFYKEHFRETGCCCGERKDGDG